MRIVTHNWRLKLAALFIASSMWGVVAYAGNPVTVHDIPRVPIQVGPLPNPSWMIISPLPPVSVTLSGLQQNLSAYDSKNLRAFIDVSHAHVGYNLLHVQGDSLDPRVSVTQVLPDAVGVTIDERASLVRKLELPLNLTIRNLPNGCCVAQNSLSTASPDSIALTGPKTLLAKVTPYVEVDVAQATTDVVQSVEVKLKGVDPRALPLITVNPQQVKVTVPVTRVKKQVPAAVHPKRVGSVASGYQITDIKTTPDTVTVEGDPGLVGSITAIDTVAVNLSGATSDIVQTVGFQPPQGITVTDATQVTVHFFISRIPEIQPSPGPTPAPSPSPSTSPKP